MTVPEKSVLLLPGRWGAVGHILCRRYGGVVNQFIFLAPYSRNFNKFNRQVPILGNMDSVHQNQRSHQT